MPNAPTAPSASGDVRQLERRHAELQILFETVRDLTSTLSTHEVIERLVDRTLQHLRSEIASVLLFEDESTLRIVHARGLPENVVGGARVALGEGIAGHVALTGRSLLIPDIEVDERFKRRNHERYYTRSCVSAPLVHQGRVRGVINVNNKQSHAAFDIADLELLEAIAGHATVAFANAHRFEEILERAQRDALTGLANHGHFWSTLELELKRAERYGRQLTLVLIDVDHFKLFNDNHGHLQGDSALIQVAHAIADHSRMHDVAARYGGEEFAILLPETTLGGGTIFGEKIRQAIESLAIGCDRGDEGLTVSVGVATLEASDDTSTSALVEAADTQLYRAKEAGRNRVFTAECC